MDRNVAIEFLMLVSFPTRYMEPWFNLVLLDLPADHETSRLTTALQSVANMLLRASVDTLVVYFLGKELSWASCIPL